MFHSKKGFTLIELLIVIAIIGVLAAIIIVNLNVVRQKSRDAKRKSDMSEVQTALVMYSQEHGGQFPSTCGTGPTTTCKSGAYSPSAAWQNSVSSPAAWIPAEGFVPDFIASLPEDPINKLGYYRNSYFYYYKSDGIDYKVMTAHMESSQGIDWAVNDGGPSNRNDPDCTSYASACEYELFSTGAQTW